MIKMTNDLPPEWRIVQFKEITNDFAIGGTPSTKNQEYWEGDIPWTTSQKIGPKILSHSEKMISKSALRFTTLVKKDDLILVSRVGLGKFSIAGLEIAINQDCTKVALDHDKINPFFLYYYLTQNKNSLIRLGQGTTILGVLRNDVEKLKIRLPPMIEQQIIVSILENMDNLIQTTQQLIEKLHECKKGLMQRLFTEGIGHTEFKNSKLGRIPKKWEYPKIKTIAKVIGGGTPSTTNEDYWNGNILWLTPTEITNLQKKYISDTERKITDLGLQNSSARIIPEHSLILTSRATIGACAINTVPLATNQGFQNLIPNERVLIDYLYYYFSYTSFQNLMKRYANGSTFLEISNKSVQNLQIPLPSLNEQEKITSILDQVHFQIINNNKFKSKMKLIKKGLMQILLTGKKRVP